MSPLRLPLHRIAIIAAFIMTVLPLPAQTDVAVGSPDPALEEGITQNRNISAEMAPAENDSVPPAPLTGVQVLELKVSPVDIDREKPEMPAMHYYDKHGEKLETPVRFLAELDTVTAVKPGPVYPIYNGTSVGLNVFDFIMMAAGQRRLSVDISIDVSMFNWIFPVVELGMGYANAWPDDERTRIRTNPTLYGKIGFNYNFLYKSDPAYQVFVGFRAGFSDFRFSATHLKPGSEFYDVNDGKDLTAVHSTAWYGQVLAGIKVRIYRCFSMGWTARYGFRFKTTTSVEGALPWFIPGYGVGPLSATYSFIFTF